NAGVFTIIDADDSVPARWHSRMPRFTPGANPRSSALMTMERTPRWLTRGKLTCDQLDPVRRRVHAERPLVLDGEAEALVGVHVLAAPRIHAHAPDVEEHGPAGAREACWRWLVVGAEL